jgi:hypothetical protein
MLLLFRPFLDSVLTNLLTLEATYTCFSYAPQPPTPWYRHARRPCCGGCNSLRRSFRSMADLLMLFLIVASIAGLIYYADLCQRI